MISLPFILAAIFLGLLASALIPYVRKRCEGKIDSFDLKYLHHSIVAAAWEFITSIVVFTQWKPPSLSGDSELLMNCIILLLAAAFGYGGLAGQKDMEKAINAILTAFGNIINKTKPTIAAPTRTVPKIKRAK